MVKVLFSWVIVLAAGTHLWAAAWTVEQQVSVKKGWSAFWLGVEDSKTANEVFAGTSIESVACFSPIAFSLAATYATSPLIESFPVQPYLVWTADESTSTLDKLPSDSIYLVRSSAACELTFSGRPVTRRMQWFDESRGMNFFGVSTTNVNGVTPGTYLTHFPNFKTNGNIYTIGGEGDLPTLSAVLIGVTKVKYGDVLVVKDAPISDWCGTFSVHPASGVDFGEAGERVSVRVKNTADVKQTITMALNADAPEDLCLRFQEKLLDPWEEITAEKPASKELEKGETWNFSLALDRTKLSKPGERASNDIKAYLTFTSGLLSAHMDHLSISLVRTEPDTRTWPAGLWHISGELNTVSSILSQWTEGSRVVSTTHGVKAPAMPISFILKSDGTNCELLQHVTRGVVGEEIFFYGPEAELPSTLTQIVRTSCILLPVDKPVVSLTPASQSAAEAEAFTASWTVEPDSPSNPFRHPYHPDHDGKSADFKTTAPDGDDFNNYTQPVKPELWSIANTLTLQLDEQSEDWLTADLRSGKVSWVLKNLRAEGDILATGTFTATPITQGLENFLND